MAKFKVGDTIVCVDANDTDGLLKVGRQYIVTAAEVRHLELRGLIYRYRCDRFELVEPYNGPEAA